MLRKFTVTVFVPTEFGKPNKQMESRTFDGRYEATEFMDASIVIWPACSVELVTQPVEPNDEV